jgi:hypothetical protein
MDEEPDLWPADIKVDVLTPLMILNCQTATLRAKTKGLLAGEVKTMATDKNQIHHFDIVAPVLDGYTHRLLTAQHLVQFVYPVDVTASYEFQLGIQSIKNWRCGDDIEFRMILSAIFSSREVKAILLSLIARCNEKKPTLDSI